jgi:hypothetical protein
MVIKAARRNRQNAGGEEIAGVDLSHPSLVLYADEAMTKRDPSV